MMASGLTGDNTIIPYNGAKEHYVLDIDNGEFAKEVVLKVESVTPLPKKRKN